ncbi:M20 family peptidase [Clostridium rectalis]|uniref:M20 family peptidase n=1 Tax=Clostridium rectalis TaxID=2040295 RepID=UPI000F63D305|nr:M20 family peptidase [Clostridium rectalis]
MKQKIATFLDSISNDIFNISKYLYDNPEASFKEFKACRYLTNILKKNNFQVTEKLLNIPTAFSAKYGEGHPKICYICEYDTIEDEGHITGHNLISSMSVAAAISLSKVMDKFQGTVIVLGCPGEFVGSSKITMKKQGIFDDIDAVLMAHPDIVTAESGSSMALLPLKINYKSPASLSYRKLINYSSLDACLFTFNSLNLLSKGLNNTSIDGVIAKGGSSPYLMPTEAEAKFYIRGTKMCYVENIEKRLREFIKNISNLMEIQSEISIYELPYEELITNSTLSRLFSHNLKESGIIDIKDPKDTYSGLSIGTISHCVPCIHPYISIVESPSIKYSSGEFAMATISNYAHDKVIKTAQALAITALDLIEGEHLLQEMKSELYKNTNKNFIINKKD